MTGRVTSTPNSSSTGVTWGPMTKLRRESVVVDATGLEPRVGDVDTPSCGKVPSRAYSIIRWSIEYRLDRYLSSADPGSSPTRYSAQPYSQDQCRRPVHVS